MSIRLPLVGLSLLIAAAGSVAVADDYFPTAATPTEAILPSDTIAMATVPNAARFRARWDRSSFGQMAADPAFGPFFDDIRSRLASLSTTFGFDPQSVWSRIDGEASLGLVKADDGSLTLVGVANFESESDSVDFLARIASAMESHGSSRIDLDLNGTTFTSWSNPSDRSRSLAYYRVGNHVVFADGLNALMDTAKRGLTSGSGSSLGSNPSYRKVKSQTRPARGTAAVRWFINPTAAVDAAISDGLADNPNLAVIRGLVAKTGLNQFRGFGGLFDLPGNQLDSVSSTYGYVEGEPTGLLRAFIMPATRQQPPRWVKDDVSLYSQMNWTPSQLVGVVREAVDAMRGAGTFDRDIAAMPVGETDVTVGGLLAQFKGSIHFAAEVPQSAEDLTRQSTIISLGVKDAESVAEIVRKLAGNRQPNRVNGTDVYAVEMPVAVPAGSPLAALRSPQLAVAVAEGQLMLSTDAEYLTGTLAGIDAGRPLAESPAYREVAANYPERTSVINYQKQDSRFAGLYEQLRAGGMPMTGTTGLAATLIGADFTKLPPFAAMSRYLQNTGGFIVPADDGFRIVNFSLEPRER